MIVKLFSVHDGKAELYWPPIAKRTTLEALRDFTDYVKKEGHPFNVHPEDYHFFELGEFDDNTCQVKMYEVKKNIGCALDYVGQKFEHSTQTQLPLEGAIQ